MLPAFAAPARPVLGQRSRVTDYLESVLLEEVPALDIVSIARRPGVQAKIALADGTFPSGDQLARVRARLDGERIEVVPWSAEPERFIASALGLAEVPPMVLRPLIAHAQVLLGEIDLHGMEGWRGINRVLASALTGWRIHLAAVGQSPGWAALAAAQVVRRPVQAAVVEVNADGARVNVHGLFARLLSAAPLSLGQTLDVRVTRMDEDEGRIFVSRRLAPNGQLSLPI